MEAQQLDFIGQMWPQPTNGCFSADDIKARLQTLKSNERQKAREVFHLPPGLLISGRDSNSRPSD